MHNPVFGIKFQLYFGSIILIIHSPLIIPMQSHHSNYHHSYHPLLSLFSIPHSSLTFLQILSTMYTHPSDCLHGCWTSQRFCISFSRYLSLFGTYIRLNLKLVRFSPRGNKTPWLMIDWTIYCLAREWWLWFEPAASRSREWSRDHCSLRHDYVYMFDHGVSNRQYCWWQSTCAFTSCIKWFCVASASEIYYLCVNTINCTGKNVSDDLLYALGEADANMYLCSKDLRPSENSFHKLC